MSTAASRSRRLPASLPPRGLSRAEAAAYIGIGTTTFDRLVGDGIMPKAIRIYDRVLWDRHALDVAFDTLSDLWAAAGDPWKDAAA